MSAAPNSELTEYKKDTRMPCKYGAKCYQKNSAHLDKYKHPHQTTKRKLDPKPGTSKKMKVKDTIEELDSKEINLDEDNKINDQKERATENYSYNKEPNDLEPDNFEEKLDKKECVSDSSESEYNEETISAKEAFDPKVFINSKFLITLPDDFYDFWEYCKELKPNNPCEALKDVGLKLVGAYDVLAGKFKYVEKDSVDYLRHWRYYYDPPELQTVLKGDYNTGYHIGYFYDSPSEPPPFLVSNHGMRDGIFSKMGDNIFAAVSIYLEEVMKTGDPFKKMHVGRLLTSIKNKTQKLNLSMSSHSPRIKARELKVVTKTLNKIGLLVPYNKKTQLGYRDLAMSDKDLVTLLNKLEKAAPEQRSKYLSDLQPVITYANIALDECDFGTGIKLGWDLLCHGIDCLDTTILQFLCNSYKLLNREAFAKIAEAHLTNRRKGCDLSIL